MSSRARLRAWTIAIRVSIAEPSIAEATAIQEVGPGTGTLAYSPVGPWIGFTVPQFLQLWHCQ
jgi:hypothetical protein